jgi:hypothetical protein
LFIVLYLGLTNWLIVSILLWSMAWKILAMWKAGQSGQKIWFVALALAPTLGILEIFYFIIYSTMSKRLKIILSLIIFISIFILLSFMGSPSKPVIDPPLSGAPYELTGTPRPKGDRIFSIDVNTAEDNDYENAFRLAKEAGSQVIPISINWKDIETSPGKYEDPGNILAIANAYYPPTKTRVALYVRSWDTLEKMAPADLKDLPFTDPQMSERYLKMIDWVFAQIPDVQLQFLSIGDEIDVLMSQDKKLYQEFETFFKTARNAIKAKKPDLKIGFSATLKALTATSPEELKSINQHSDIVLVSYYPLNDDFSVQDPTVVRADIDALLNQYPGRTVYTEQAGYPTSALLNSSEAKQREFIREMFGAWDRHASQIQYVSFTWLHDLPQAALDFYQQYYGSSDARFMEYLRTLGFRTYAGNGEDKESFRAIKAEAKQRGW